MKNKRRVIPGFGLSMGVTLTMLSIIVIIPLASLLIYTAKMKPSEFWETITRQRVLSSFYVSFLTAFVASAINAVFGFIVAWVLVRYDFPGKRIMDGMIELPFALPTAVAGMALTYLTSSEGWIGKFFWTIWNKDCLHENRYYRCSGVCWYSFCSANRTASIGKAGSCL